jgi:hypothetical protein
MGRTWVCFGLALWVAACGGRSERQEGSDDGGAVHGDDDVEGGDKPNDDDDNDVPGDDVALPSCELGPRDEGQSGEDCLWLAKGRCYADKLEACACVCPRDRESICSSDFDNEAGRTPVSCY